VIISRTADQTGLENPFIVKEREGGVGRAGWALRHSSTREGASYEQKEQMREINLNDSEAVLPRIMLEDPMGKCDLEEVKKRRKFAKRLVGSWTLCWLPERRG